VTATADGRIQRALVIDSDPANVEMVTAILASGGFATCAADSWRDAFAVLSELDPDVVVMEIDLRDGSGLDACRDLRRRSDVPVLILSRRTSEFDVVVALEVGADGYVMQPFRPRELLARVRALVRRTPRAPRVDADVVTVGELMLDVARHVVEVRGEPVALPLKEFALLELLMRHAGKALTREFLVEQVWGRGRSATKTLDLHIKRLRDHLELDAANPKALITVRGFGFRLEAAELQGR
jgi:two-component system response regulator RegX3